MINNVPTNQSRNGAGLKADEPTLHEALRDLANLTGKLALRVIVLEAALQDAVACMPDAHKARFAQKFRATAANLMQSQSERLSAQDDSDIAAAINRVLKASKE